VQSSNLDFHLPTPATRRFAGFLLAACSLLTLVAVSHHPTVRGVHGTAALEAIARLGASDRLVHGALILLFSSMLFSLTVHTISGSRTLHLGVTAWVAFLVAYLAVLGAMLIDGFFVPAYAERALHLNAADTAPAMAVLNAAAVAIQISTKLGFVALGIAVLLWSFDLLADNGQRRVVGIVGLLAATAVVVLVLVESALNPHSLLIIIGVQAVWFLGLGWVMFAPAPGSNSTAP
jgi:hypothetical protein